MVPADWPRTDCARLTSARLVLKRRIRLVPATRCSSEKARTLQYPLRPSPMPCVSVHIALSSILSKQTVAQVIDYPDAPQGEVLRYDFAFYGNDYGAVYISERLGPASLDYKGLLHSDRLLFCLTYWARMIHNLGRHNTATGLISHVKTKVGLARRPLFGFDDASEVDYVFSGLAPIYEADAAIYKHIIVSESSEMTIKPRKTWSAIMNRDRYGTLSCQPKVSFFGNVAAMSISSTLALFNRTMRLATPAWRNMLLVGLGAMIYYYEEYDHSKDESISVAPSAGWEAVKLATEAIRDEMD